MKVMDDLMMSEMELSFILYKCYIFIIYLHYNYS